MSTPLNLFPERIRWCNPDGTLTMEALRMLQVLVQRVGGTIGDAGVDTFPVMPPDGDQQQPSFEMISAVAGAAPAGADPVLMQPTAAAAMFETTFQGSSE